MSASAIRIRKEARAMFWPWCAVTLAGISPAVLPHRYAEPISFLSFFIGIPLLAVLPIGMEFHHGTLALWLTQPASRLQLWREKTGVMLPAAISAAVVSGIGMFVFTWPRMLANYRYAAVAYVVVALTSATLVALTARSTLGGLLLISLCLFFGQLFGAGISDTDWKAYPLSQTTVAALLAVGACYGAVMLWLGARKLVSFQATGGSADADILASGPSLAPAFLARWLRCRSAGAFLNLLRKEIGLLRPLWLMALMVGLYVAFLAGFGLLPSPPAEEPRTVWQWAMIGPLVSLCVAMAGLSGILLVGEEKTSGTLAWHMTLPISLRRQWLMKLVLALVAGLACSVALPVLTMMAGGCLHGSPLMYVNVRPLPDDLIMFGVLILVCFWSACAANGTVGAALWAAPVTAVMFISRFVGTWLGQALARSTGTLSDVLTASLHQNPLALAGLMEFARGSVLWLFVPVLLVGVIQSYRLFRTPPQGGVWWMLRCLAPLVAVTVLWSFCAYAGFAGSRWQPFLETVRAIDKAPALLTGEDLAKSQPLTPLTQRWLAGAQIAVDRDPADASRYRTTIHLASGVECKLTVTRAGAMAASCGK